MAPRCTTATVLLLILAGSLRAEPDPKLTEDVKRAIQKGQKYLKEVQPVGDANPELSFVGGVGCGPACLQGLALIESGLPTNDKVLVNLVQAARHAALRSYSTYEIALLIMFFDRYGAKEDEPFIQFLTLRLKCGQTNEGAWSYQSHGLMLDPVQERALYGEFTKGNRLVTPATPKKPKPEPKPRTDIEVDPPAPKKEAPPPKKDEKPGGGLHPLIREIQKGARGQPPGPGTLIPLGDGDHSNTQFATVGLWCGRRHHVDVSDALARLDKHYRNCQQRDGGWGYTSAPAGSSPAMTCAGLMGLAMAFGGKSEGGPDKEVKVDADAIAKDRVVSDGLKALGDFLAAAVAQEDGRRGREFAHTELSRNLYFMWSLERVGMVYGLKTIGKVDWYDWGSRLLVDSQDANGSWASDGFHSGSSENSTAFALLFLSRANLAEDLASSLKGKVKDPGTSSLKSGKDLNEMLGKADKGSAGTKQDPGITVPKADPPVIDLAKAAKKLAAALVAASGPERVELLRQYRDTKGSEYTDALALAIGQLKGDAQAEAREALASRLTRMNANTLNEMMRDRDKELRRAAALATAAKGPAKLAEFADSLIRLIADDDTLVVQAARTSLKALSGKDLGPEVGSSAADRTKALQAWQQWWKAEPK